MLYILRKKFIFHSFLNYILESNKYVTTISNVNHTSNPTMLQSVGIEYEKSYRREATTDVNTGSEIELLLSPFAIINNTSSTTNSSDSTVNEVLNHQWTFYIEVGIYFILKDCGRFLILIQKNLSFEI